MNELKLIQDPNDFGMFQMVLNGKIIQQAPMVWKDRFTEVHYQLAVQCRRYNLALASMNIEYEFANNCSDPEQYAYPVDKLKLMTSTFT